LAKEKKEKTVKDRLDRETRIKGIRSRITIVRNRKTYNEKMRAKWRLRTAAQRRRLALLGKRHS
jgi:hypothetical protein